MKNKLMSLLIIATVVTIKSQAQNTTKVNPGGIYTKGGYNAANISTHNDGTVDDATALSTFHVGLIADIPLAPVLSLQTGLLLNGQGAKVNYYADPNNTSDNYVKSSFNPLYVELPANLAVKIPIGNDARIYVGAGPYVAMGVGGRIKTETSLLGNKSSSSDDIKFNDDYPTTDQQEGARFDRLKRFDFGINGLAGVEIKRFSIGVNYGLGLTKISSVETDNSSNDKNKYRTFSVGLGVRL